MHLFVRAARESLGQSKSLRQVAMKSRGIPPAFRVFLSPRHQRLPSAFPFFSDPNSISVSVLELETLKKAFLSSAEGGVLSRTQLACVFSDVGFGPVPSDRMFDLFDKDGNGTVS